MVQARPKKTRAPKLSKVIGATVDRVAEKGVKNKTQIEKEMSLLIKNFKSAVNTDKKIEEQTAKILRGVYRRATKSEEVHKNVPWVKKFTIENVEHKLRPELNKRIYASINLIKLNRDESIRKAQQRAAGWLSSVPDGGTSESNAELKKVIEHIKAPIEKNTFEERRVAIDQGHKLVAAVNDIIADDAGAIGGFWHSNFRRTGYNAREDHKEMDGHFYFFKKSWPVKKGYVLVSKIKFIEDTVRPAQEPYCSCSYYYVNTLSEVPDEYLSDAGRKFLE